MSATLEIRQGGLLFEKYWFYDKIAEKGEYRERDITHLAFRNLFDKPCALAPNLCLKDILLLLNKHLTIFNAVLGNWCDELVKEGLQDLSPSWVERRKRLAQEQPKDHIEYLELYWHLSKWDTDLHGHEFPSFHGIGFEQESERSSFAVEYTPVNELADLPIKLNHNFPIYDEKSHKKEDTVCYQGAIFTLGHILFGIVWELSFCGSPSMRNERSEELAKRIEDIENGTVETIPWDEKDDDKNG